MVAELLRPLKRLLLQLAFLLLCYFISRCLFTYINLQSFEGLTLTQFFSIAFHAFRFDISAIFSINCVYIFLLLFPFYQKENKIRDKIIQGVFILCNSIAFLFEISDWAYFPYNHKRATSDVLDLIGRKGDFVNLLPGFLQDYWYVPLSAILLICLFIVVNKKISAATPFRPSERSYWLRSLRLVVVGVITVIAIRGGWQLVPIGLRNAIEKVNSKFAPIVLNTPFSIISTATNKKLEAEHYYDEETLKQLIHTTKIYNKKQFSKKNVVIIVLESFSKEFTGIGGLKSYTPFLDSLMQQSLVCTNAFANCNRSADGIPAILAGIPSFQEEPFTTSVYGANSITSISNLLAKKGYSSTFYHGGTNGTMSLNLFASNAGFQRYKGRNEYPRKEDFDGHWGIYDEPFLQFALQDIDQNLKPPFCASIFTLSSHPPFAIPEHYKNSFPKGTLDIHQSIGYADYALQQFFAQAKRKKWFDNTLFIIVADHCSPLSEDNYYNNHQGRFAIPLLYCCPSDTGLKGNTSLLTQQIDILPSVMDYLGYPDSFFAFGNSIFSAAPYRYTVQHWSGDIFYTMDNYFMPTSAKKPTGLFDAAQDKLNEHDLRGSKDSILQISLQRLNALRQVYSNGMINNELKLK